MAFFGICIQIIPVLHHIRHAVLILIPVLLPVLRQQIRPVVQHRRLHIDRDTAAVGRTVHGRLICLPRALRNLLIAGQLLYRKRVDMFSLGVLHDDIIRLV